MVAILLKISILRICTLQVYLSLSLSSASVLDRSIWLLSLRSMAVESSISHVLLCLPFSTSPALWLRILSRYPSSACLQAWQAPLDQVWEVGQLAICLHQNAEAKPNQFTLLGPREAPQSVESLARSSFTGPELGDGWLGSWSLPPELPVCSQSSYSTKRTPHSFFERKQNGCRYDDMVRYIIISSRNQIFGSCFFAPLPGRYEYCSHPQFVSP